MLYRLRWIFIVCLLSILPVGSMAQTLSASDYRPTTHSINVAFYNLPGKDIITEVSISVWNEVAAALHQPFNLVKAASQAQALQWLKTKKVRLVLGPLTLQNQQPGVWYVNSYVENADGVIIPTRLQIDFWKTIKDYFEAIFGLTVGIILVAIFLFGVGIWLAERKRNPEMFSKRPVRGIFDAVWQCLVTFSTVGYGDIVPKTPIGRVITGVWIFLSLFLVSAFVASITSELTYIKSRSDRLDSLSQLYAQRLGFVEVSKGSQHSIEKYHGKPVAFDTLAQLVDAVASRDVYAGLDNKIILSKYLSDNPQSQVILTPYKLVNGNFAFAVRRGDKLHNALTNVLYTMSEVGKIDMAVAKVVGVMPMSSQHG